MGKECLTFPVLVHDSSVFPDTQTVFSVIPYRPSNCQDLLCPAPEFLSHIITFFPLHCGSFPRPSSCSVHFLCNCVFLIAISQAAAYHLCCYCFFSKSDLNFQLKMGNQDSYFDTFLMSLLLFLLSWLILPLSVSISI